METIRTFIAVELPSQVRDALAAAEQALQRAAPSAAHAVKWVDPGSIHLTLKFLGETPAASVQTITLAMQQATAASRPLSLSLSSAGCFPNARQPRVLWVGLSGDTAGLAQLQTAIETTVSPLGFPSEERRFTPHLTLGRVRDDCAPDARQRLGVAIQSLRLPAVRFTVSGVSLMRSELHPTGAVYTCLAEALIIDESATP